MRQAIMYGEYYEKADLNCDEKVDNSDLQILSDFLLVDSYIIDAYLYDDADEDGICDMLEVSLLKSDPDSCDTDNDGLSDFNELMYTNTSPTNKYTRGLEITDALDDPDEDNLTNKEEINNNTNPLLNDSDFDAISDYDEINIYNTDPNSEDSDNDGITDGDEIQLGLSPDKDKSDGMLSDNCRTFEHQIPSSDVLLSGINTDDSPYEVSIDISSAGNYEKALSITSIQLTDDSTADGIIGESVELKYTDGLSVDNVKIYFKSKDLEGSIEDYMVFEFFPENNYLLPVETKYTDDSAYVETNELGTFCLVSINNININDIGETNDNKPIEVVCDYELGEVEVAFIVDVSGSIDINLETTKQSIHDCSKALFDHSKNANVTIIGHYVSIDQSKICFANITNSDKDTIFNDIESVDQALAKLNKVTTDEDSILNGSIISLDQLKDELYTNSAHKYAFIMCDSVYSFSDRMQYQLTVPQMVRESLGSLYDSGIQLKFLLSSDCFKYKEAINNLKEACARYDFEVLSKADTGYFGDTEFSRIYSDAVIKKNSEAILFTGSSNPSIIPSSVNRNAFINSLPSSIDPSTVPPANDDGEVDFIEASIASGAAHYDKDGNVVFTNYKDACYANDLTRSGYDQLILKYGIELRVIAGDIQITPFNDKILYVDSDGDGLKNKDDPYPNEPFDDRFEIVDDFEPSIDFVNRHIEISNKCANTKFPTPVDLGEFTLFSSFVTGGLTAALPFIQLLSGQIDNFENISSIHFSSFMSWFLWGNGQNYHLSSDEMFSIIFGSKNNKEHYSYNINQLRKAAEGIVNDDNKMYYIAVKPVSLFKAACYKGHCCFQHNITYFDDSTAADWGYSLGESLGTMVAEVYKINDKYNMKVKYYIIDNYEYAVHWEREDESSFLDRAGHQIHEAGLAHEFKISGCYEDMLLWKKGEILYPDDYIEIVLNEEEYNAKPYK